MMTLHLALAPDEEAKLRESAARLGLDLQTFVREAALEKADRPTLSELLSPIHEETRRRGITVEQVDEAVSRARKAYCIERGAGSDAATPTSEE
jgi:uncharacterized protein (DUF1778 family)